VSLSPVRALSLDVDDTLIDTRAASLAAVLDAFDGALPAPVADEAAVWVADAGGHYEPYQAGAIGFDEQRRRRYVDLARALGVDASDAAFDVCVQRCEAALRRVRPYDEVRGFLDAVAGRGSRSCSSPTPRWPGSRPSSSAPGSPTGSRSWSAPTPPACPSRSRRRSGPRARSSAWSPRPCCTSGTTSCPTSPAPTRPDCRRDGWSAPGVLPVPCDVERVTALREVSPLLG
jgi:hypothetical protein